MTDDELIKLLYTEGDRLARERADEVVARGAEIVPRLAEIVTKTEAWAAEGDASWAPIHAVYLLGAIGGEAAVAPLVEALRFACEDEVDWAYDAMPAIFSRIGVPAAGPLADFVRDDAEEDFARMVACDALGTLARRHPEARDPAADALRAAAESRKADRDVRWCAAFQLLCLGRPGDRPVVEEMGREQDKEGGIGFFSSKDIESAFAGTPPLPVEGRDWMRFYDPKEIEARQKRWEEDAKGENEFEEGEDGVEHDYDYEHEEGEPPPRPIVNTESVPARNDPCPCGSGRKYKKCCGR